MKSTRKAASPRSIAPKITLSMYPPPGQTNMGNFIAWDAKTGKIVWSDKDVDNNGAMIGGDEICILPACDRWKCDPRQARRVSGYNCRRMAIRCASVSAGLSGGAVRVFGKALLLVCLVHHTRSRNCLPKSSASPSPMCITRTRPA